MKNIIAFILFVGITFSQLHAQGIRGTITTNEGVPLSFATVYVRSIETGVASNIDGKYEVRLTSGKYDLVYQYMGYETLIKVVDVGTDFAIVNVALKAQTIMLKDVTIRAGKEDPASTIMRKAIAKSKYHANQLDAYEATVYLKGSGRVKDMPFLIQKMVEKEGEKIDSTMAFTTESVSEVKYTRPNKIEEKVISIRTSGNDNNTSPMQFINSSFYEPKIIEAVSPLSPRAFSYYKFRYDGSFTDRGYTISKIRVIPRINGDNVFRGDIFIVEDYWSLYSLDLTATIYGIDINIEQIYEPIEDKVWMPVTHKFYGDAKILGFDFEYNYLATIGDYEITINPELAVDIEVVDEKVEKELAQEITKDVKKSKNSAAMERLVSGEEITRKDLRKIMREYEKQELKEEFDEPDVIEERTFNYDSSAYKNDSLYWAKIRPVPLTEYETRGYEVADSIAIVQQGEEEGDTLKVTKKDGFKIYDPIMGNTYKIGKRAHLEINSPLLSTNFNTAEGYNVDYSVELTKTFENTHWMKFSPLGRYSVARNQFSGKVMMEYIFGDILKKKRTAILLSGGKYVSQIKRDNLMSLSSEFNSSNGMLPIINTFYTLMLESNYMKVYEKDFVEIRMNKKLSDKVKLEVKASWEDRIPLTNNTQHTWIDWKGVNYTSNTPEHISAVSTSFQRHHATLLEFDADFKPWLKYRLYNNKKKAIRNSSPLISTKLTTSVNLFENDVDYTFLKLGIKHKVDVGVRGVLHYNINAGAFLRRDSLSFIDYAHFQGNLSPFTRADPVQEYRILDYYRYSSNNYYLSGLFNYQFRKFFITQIPWVNKQGVKENVFVNYLGTESLNSYMELGYSWNHIYRIFKIEAVTSFENGKYKDWGIRIGVAAGLNDFFTVN